MIVATKGAYTLQQLEEMPFHRLLELWEAVAYYGTVQWLSNEPTKYVKQEPRK